MPQLSLEEISDRLHIHELLARYALAVDTKDWTLLDSCFAPGANVDYTASGGKKGSYAEIRRWLEKALAPFEITAHYVTNILVALEGNSATARSYLLNPMGFKNPDSSLHWFTVGAMYADKLVRTDDGWRIEYRAQERAFFQGSLPGAG